VLRGDMILLMRKPKKYSDALRGISPTGYLKNYLQKEKDSW